MSYDNDIPAAPLEDDDEDQRHECPDCGELCGCEDPEECSHDCEDVEYIDPSRDLDLRNFIGPND